MSTTRDKLTVENTSVREDKLYVGDPDEAVFLSRSLKVRHLRSCDKVRKAVGIMTPDRCEQRRKLSYIF